MTTPPVDETTSGSRKRDSSAMKSSSSNTGPKPKRKPDENSRNHVTRGIAVLKSNKLNGAFCEFLEKHTDAQIFEGFEVLKKGLQGKFSFPKDCPLAKKYLMAARLVFNNLPISTRKRYERLAKDRIRHANATGDLPLFRPQQEQCCDETMPKMEQDTMCDRHNHSNRLRNKLIEEEAVLCAAHEDFSDGFANAEQLSNHLIRDHECVRLYGCNSCHRGFSSLQLLQSHTECSAASTSTVEYVQLIYSCKHCGCHIAIRPDNSNWKNVLQFIELHNADGLIPVLLHTSEFEANAEYKFSATPSMLRNLKIGCEPCHQTFTNADDLESHFKGAPHFSSAPHECPSCNETFVQEPIYKAHLMTHLPSTCRFGEYLSSVCDETKIESYKFAASNTPSIDMSTKENNNWMTWPKDSEVRPMNSDLQKSIMKMCNVEELLAKGFNISPHLYTASELSNELTKCSIGPTTQVRSFIVNNKCDLSRSLAQMFDSTFSIRTNGGVVEVPQLSQDRYRSIYFCKTCSTMTVGMDETIEHCRSCLQIEVDRTSKSMPEALTKIIGADAYHNSRLTCPLCPSREKMSCCSLLGLRQHLVTAHGILSTGEPSEGEVPSQSREVMVNLVCGLSENGQLTTAAQVYQQLKAAVNSPSTKENEPVMAAPAVPNGALVRKPTDDVVIFAPSSDCKPPMVAPSTTSTSTTTSSSRAQPAEPVEVILLSSDDEDEPQVVSAEAERPPSVVTPSTIPYEASRTVTPTLSRTVETTEMEVDEPPSVIEAVTVVESGTVDAVVSSPAKSDFRRRLEEANDADRTPRECELCNVVLVGKRALIRHLNLHKEDLSCCYLCEPAKQNIVKPFNLIEHIKLAHVLPSNSAKLCCRFCEVSMESSRFVSHVLYDCYMAPCGICGKKFDKHAHRTNHMRKHKRIVERFVCRCKAAFPSTSIFERHTCVLKPKFSCELCEELLLTTEEADEHFAKEHMEGTSCTSCEVDVRGEVKEHGRTHAKPVTNEAEAVAAFAAGRVHVVHEDHKELYQIQEPTAAAQVVETMGTNPPAPTGDDQQASSSKTLPSSTREFVGATLERLKQLGFDGSSTPSPSANSVDSPKNAIAAQCSTIVREESQDGASNVVHNFAIEDDDDEIEILHDKTIQNIEATNSPAGFVAIEEGDDECMAVAFGPSKNNGEAGPAGVQREKKFKCAQCPCSFFTQSALDGHMFVTHPVNYISEDLKHEDLGVPIDNRPVWICRECAVAFETVEKAVQHEENHKRQKAANSTRNTANIDIKGCSTCSRLTMNNHDAHCEKHRMNTFSFVCSCHLDFKQESQYLFHLHHHHKAPVLAFCKRCFEASADHQRIYNHCLQELCSPPERRRMKPVDESKIGFCVASDLHFQPNNRAAYDAELAANPGNFAVATECGHRSFILYGEKFHTCPQEKCNGLVTHVSFLSHLEALNNGTMQRLPDATVVEDPSKCLLAVLRSSQSGTPQQPQRPVAASSAGTSSSRGVQPTPARPSATGSSAPAKASRMVPPIQAIPPTTQSRLSTTATARAAVTPSTSAIQGNTLAAVLAAQAATPPSCALAAQSTVNAQIAAQNQFETAVHTQLQTLFQLPMCYFCGANGQLNAFIEVFPAEREGFLAILLEMLSRMEPMLVAQHKHFCLIILNEVNARRFRYTLCHQHFMKGNSPQRVPVAINQATFRANYPRIRAFIEEMQKRREAVVRAYSIPSTSMPGARPTPSTSATTQAVEQCNNGPVDPCTLCSLIGAGHRVPRRCLIQVPTTPSLRHHWVQCIKGELSATNPNAVNVFDRITQQPGVPILLCVRHFNPRSLEFRNDGFLVHNNMGSMGELPVADIARHAPFSDEFNRAFGAFVEKTMDQTATLSTLRLMLQRVKETTKCGRCANALVGTVTCAFHHKHGAVPRSYFICIFRHRCFAHFPTEAELVRHYYQVHLAPQGQVLPMGYKLDCPMRDCNVTCRTIPLLRKHLNQEHRQLFPVSSDNCGAHFATADHARVHNCMHEAHPTEVSCCYLCGTTKPWDMGSISHTVMHTFNREIGCAICCQLMQPSLPGENPLLAHFRESHMQGNRCTACNVNVNPAQLGDHIDDKHKITTATMRFDDKACAEVRVGSQILYLGMPPSSLKPLHDL